MYTPKFNQVTDRAVLLDAMRENSFAVLAGPSNGAEGGLSATHLPLVVKDEGEHGILEGHFAKANRHWEALAGRETLVIFSGPHSYISPALYADTLAVPTWNYIAVHAYGLLEVIDEPAQKDSLLKGLIAIHEPSYADQWRALPEGYRKTMLAGIVGFRIPIARIEGKFKLSQNRSQAERNNVRAAHEAGNSEQRSLAGWMQRLGS